MGKLCRTSWPPVFSVQFFVFPEFLHLHVEAHSWTNCWRASLEVSQVPTDMCQRGANRGRVKNSAVKNVPSTMDLKFGNNVQNLTPSLNLMVWTWLPELTASPWWMGSDRVGGKEVDLWGSVRTLQRFPSCFSFVYLPSFLFPYQILYTGIVVYAPALALNQGESLMPWWAHIITFMPDLILEKWPWNTLWQVTLG